MPRPFKHHHAWHQKWHASPWRRLFFVTLFSVLISVVLWTISSLGKLDVQLVYSMCTGVSIWFLTDIARQWVFPTRGMPWSRNWKVWLFIAASIALGFVVGMLIGDWYAGHSTLDLWKFAPHKLAGLIVMCISISSAFVIFFYQQNRLQVAVQQATESKLQLLQSQLEPHMLFNTLANLRALIDVDALRAQNMLDRLIDYLRATLGASRVTSHALALEFDRLDDYLALMQIRMGSRLTYRLDLPDDLRATPCPALLLQPVVENAVLHGLEPSQKGGEIVVAAALVGRQLQLTVTDTGLGFDNTEDHASSESNSGFGLTQLRERLATLYGIKAGIDIGANLPLGTTVTIQIPHTASNHETHPCPYC